MQNIVINMDNTNNQDVKDGVETITELIEDGTTNVNNGINYIQLDGDNSFTKKNTTVEEIIVPFNKQYTIKKSFNDRYSKFLDIVQSLITTSGNTLEDGIVTIAKIVYNAITSV